MVDLSPSNTLSFQNVTKRSQGFSSNNPTYNTSRGGSHHATSTPVAQSTTQGMTRTTQKGQERYNNGNWEVTKPYAQNQSKNQSQVQAQTNQKQSKNVIKSWTSGVVSNVKSNAKDIIGAGGYVDIPSGIDFFNIKRIGYGTSLKATQERELREQEISSFNQEVNSFSQKQNTFVTSSDILKLPGNQGYVTFNPVDTNKFNQLESERLSLQAKGDLLGEKYKSSLATEKLEKSKTFESRFNTIIQEPIAKATTQKVLKNENLFSESFIKGYNKAMPVSGNVDLGIVQGSYSMVRNKPVEVAGLVAMGFVAEPAFGAIAKGTSLVGSKIPISISIGSKSITAGKIATFGAKAMPYVLGGTYVAGKTYELFSAPNQFAKGEVLGKTFVEVGAMGIGAGAYQGIKTYKAKQSFMAEAEKSPVDWGKANYYVQGKNVISFQRGTQTINGKKYGVVVEQKGIIQEGGFQTIKGSRLVAYGQQGSGTKLVRADIFSQTENLGTGQFKQGNEFFDVLSGKKVKTSVSYTEIKPSSIENYDIKGNEVWNMFGEKLNPSYSRSINVVKRTGKNTFDFFSVQADKFRTFDSGKQQLMGDKYPSYGSGKVIKIKGGSPSVDTGSDSFSFIYNKKTGTWYNPEEWTSAIKVSKSASSTSNNLIDVTSPKSSGTSGNTKWSEIKTISGSGQKLSLVEKAPTYVGGQGKQVSIFSGTGQYESSVGSFMAKTFAPTVSVLNFGGTAKGASLFSMLSFNKEKDLVGNKNISNVSSSLNQKTTPVIIQDQSTVTKTVSGTKQVQIQTPIQTQPTIQVTPLANLNANIGGFGFPPFELPGTMNLSFGSGFGRSTLRGRGYKYQPSFGAILLGKKGKAPKFSTGLGLRPILTTKSTRRKRK